MLPPPSCWRVPLPPRHPVAWLHPGAEPSASRPLIAPAQRRRRRRVRSGHRAAAPARGGDRRGRGHSGPQCAPGAPLLSVSRPSPHQPGWLDCRGALLSVHSRHSRRYTWRVAPAPRRHCAWPASGGTQAAVTGRQAGRGRRPLCAHGSCARLMRTGVLEHDLEAVVLHRLRLRERRPAHAATAGE